MQKRWTILEAKPEKVSLLQQSLKIHSAICKILVQRNIETFEDAKSFYRPALTDLHDPWLMKDMDKAVERIVLAIERRKKFSSSATMMLTVRQPWHACGNSFQSVRPTWTFIYPIATGRGTA